jgi:hypothetical protein
MRSPIIALATALAVSLVPAVTSAQTTFGVLNVWLKKHESADAPNDQRQRQGFEVTLKKGRGRNRKREKKDPHCVIGLPPDLSIGDLPVGRVKVVGCRCIPGGSGCGLSACMVGGVCTLS